MPYATLEGTRIESDDAGQILSTLAASAFGGPYETSDYLQQLASRSELAVGVTLDPADPAAAVEALITAGILQKVA